MAEAEAKFQPATTNSNHNMDQRLLHRMRAEDPVSRAKLAAMTGQEGALPSTPPLSVLQAPHPAPSLTPPPMSPTDDPLTEMITTGVNISAVIGRMALAAHRPEKALRFVASAIRTLFQPSRWTPTYRALVLSRLSDRLLDEDWITHMCTEVLPNMKENWNDLRAVRLLCLSAGMWAITLPDLSSEYFGVADEFYDEDDLSDGPDLEAGDTLSAAIDSDEADETPAPVVKQAKKSHHKTKTKTKTDAKP